MAPEAVVLPSHPTVRGNEEEYLECKAVGAFPEANVSWLLDGRPLNFTAQEVSRKKIDYILLFYFN